MAPSRRGLPALLLGAAGAASVLTDTRKAWAQQPPRQQAAPRRTGDLWFDPTQLPSFTGTVDRYLLNPQGRMDALLFREGPQIVFPPDVAEAVRQAAPPGRPLTVWGIRARSAPVITMLAFSPGADTTPRIVERPYWRLDAPDPQAQSQRLSVSGTVRQPYYSPQGEVVGAVFEDGTVVMLPQGKAPADGVRDLLKSGAKLAAEGPGAVAPAAEGGGGTPLRALIAERIGENADSLRPAAAADPAR